ncbi:extracellular solute-binding protein [Micromonospora sp. 4G57]|uniref:Extracellular solute-binding protein n=1 Tax=Micromonospora sicca TaxID=2202420 RepID=A0ABU5JDY9_9ACTN|nr:MULTISPECIES: extracellular solute-binding protein [unclassified Micromonospora]MDZ5445077.1 extracellular solute-binding protein [Micromonospora sp. 4G57]MDZ5490803.1 extracellular solute-binding protein [Micromonospora sp. 4G53]
MSSPDSSGHATKRRLAALLPVTGVCLLVTACGGSTPVSTTPAENLNDKTVDQLYEGAKKEGTLVLYAADSGKDLIPGFEKQYPGVKVQYFQQQGEQSAAKAAAEARAGVYNVDVIDTEQNTSYSLSQTGLLAKYSPPAGADVDAKYKTPYFTGYRVQLKPIAYNTKLVATADVPKSLDDLSDPKWANKICAEPSEVSVFADMVQDLGQDQTEQYWKTLTSHGLRFVSGQTNLVQSVLSGDCPVAVSANLHTVAKNAAKGAPIGWVKTDPLYGNYGAVNVAAKAPHPYAARLWANYVLSPVGQQVVIDAYRVPSNHSVAPKEPELADNRYNAVVAGDEVMKNFSKYNTLYYTTTGRPVTGG